VFFSIYLLIVGNALVSDFYYKWDLSQYDLDKNGFFDNKEITQNQIKALEKVSHDTGRNLSFITGFIFSFLLAGILYLVLLIKSRVTKQLNKT
jgi:uncharacterized membrane protein YciS (DUF1049 family)